MLYFALNYIWLKKRSLVILKRSQSALAARSSLSSPRAITAAFFTFSVPSLRTFRRKGMVSGFSCLPLFHRRRPALSSLSSLKSINSCNICMTDFLITSTTAILVVSFSWRSGSMCSTVFLFGLLIKSSIDFTLSKSSPCLIACNAFSSHSISVFASRHVSFQLSFHNTLAMISSEIFPISNTTSAIFELITAFGIQKLHMFLHLGNHKPVPSFSSLNPIKPSLPIPVRMTPIALESYACAVKKASGGQLKVCRHIQHLSQNQQ